MILFVLLTTLAVAETLIDYQLYSKTVGSEYSRVHFPDSGNKAAVNFNTRASYSPVVTKHQDKIIARDVEYLFRNEVGFEKYFGKGNINPFVVGQLATEVIVGDIEKQPLLQDRNVVAGVSMGKPDDLRVSVGVVKGTGFHSKENSTGILGSIGFSGEKFGVAGSIVVEDVMETESATRASVGTYYQKNDNRFTVEFDRPFVKEYEPSDITLGLRKSFEHNSRNVDFFSTFSFNPVGNAGAGPSIAFGFSFDLQKNKKPVDEERYEDIEQPEEKETTIDVTPETTEESEQTVEIVEINEEKPIILTESANDTEVIDSSQNNQKPIGTLNTKQGNYSKKVKSKINSQKGEEIMPDDNGKELKSHEVQPVTSGVSTDGLSNIAQQTGGDSNLAMFLAIIAVVGGGAAWKFYSQFAEQKHEQKMKEMELQAKAQGLGSASPPPCQAAQAEMKAEMKAMKAKMNSTAAMLEDVDFGMYERKLKKLDKRLKALEDPEEE